jgi:hypothetical protein
MSSSAGFGQPKPSKKVSKSSAQRSAAAQQYDQMKADGLPEFAIFIRIKDKKPWYPVGSLAVNRSNKINQAIFDQQAELLQGAFRLFPVLRKHQANLEYGYRLKQYPDEPIQLAVKPVSGSGNGLQTTLGQLRQGITGLFNRQSSAD